VMGSSMILLEDYGSRLDDDAKDNLYRMSAAAKKMAQLIDDLLQLSRITRSDVERQRVDLAEIAHDVEAELRSRGEQATVQIKPDMVVDADPRLLRAAMVNLLENAHKFSARRPEPRIEIGSEKRDGRFVYYVRDNGVGFDMAYIDKIFRPFERLHRDTEYPGTGIGLANVKRIIERHGGQLWAESEEGKGATFYFTL
jgi:light-regulated signal transduction histidine kinase (bacteriophytochrome)